jgi:hypothetical protein
MIKTLIAGGAVLFGCATISQADRYDRGYRYDRGDRYSHNSSGRWSVGVGYSSGGYYGGDRSYVSIGYRSSNFRGSYTYSSGPVYYAPRPVYVSPPVYYTPRPVYVAPPVVYRPAPVVIERPVYVAPPVVYYTTPSYYYQNCGPSYYGGVTYYYGR